MKIAIWAMVAVIALAAIGGAVFLATHDPRQPIERSPKGGAQIKNPTASSGMQSYKLDVDGMVREFIVYRPKALAETEEASVVFMFHGSGGSGPQMYKETGWKDQADAEGFMVVYPTALKYHVYSEEKVIEGQVKTDVSQFQTKWNAYELPGLLDESYPDQTLYDDVKFTKEMIAFIEENYAVDTDRYYATGFSNGGQFTTRLAVEMSDVFAAYAPTSAGVVPDEVLAKLDQLGQQPTPRSVIQVIGANDAKAVHSAGVTEFTTDETAANDGDAIKDKYISNYLSLEQLEDEYVYENKMNAAHFTYTTSAVGATNQYQIYVVDNMGHIYPNGNNSRFDVAEIFWPFFEQHSL